ncbi:MAG: S8 family serine peptidase [Lutibacter sp.]|nr:S8 family serine peptidase [Lutibacter sp.]
MKRIIFGLFIIALFFNVQQINAQKKEDIDKIKSTYDLEKLSNLEKESRKRNKDDKQKADSLANQKGWGKKIEFPDGSIAELQRVSNEGKPIYYTTFNVDASKSTRTNHLNSSGSLGLNLNGNNMTAHVWDNGIARITHQEYDGPGGNNRYSVGDGTTTLNFHAAHVTGTIMASGIVARAKGMAPESNVIGYDWILDEPEVISAASNGMLISNHSYGFRQRDLYGNPLLPNYYFGGYITESRTWDEIMFNAPYYLMVVAAGNSGNDDTVNGSPLNGLSGFDKLTGHSTSKNNLVVANAQDANVTVEGYLVSAIINSTSSEGPTDDLRIKPDITGNGTDVYSTFEFSDNAYNEFIEISGTSMATPNVAGSLLLLQEHWYNLNSSYLKSATLKGLVLHTADDLGSTGPDAIYGWGLLNSKKAAETITSEGNESKIDELTLNSGNSYTFTVDSDGVNPLIASISWTDRAGIATTQLNSTTPILVNDLDIKVFKSGITYYPYKLESVTTTGTGDNSVDPFELVNVNNASGTYTITISHKGTLIGGNQNYSLIVTGISNIELLGTSLICSSSSETFTLNNVGTNVSWQTSPNLQITSSSNSSITVKPLNSNVNDAAFIKAILPNNIVMKDVWIGIPRAYTVGFEPVICSGVLPSEDIYSLPVSPGAETYHLTSNSPFLTVTGYVNPEEGVFLYASQPGNYTLTLTTSNDCGSKQSTIFVTAISCGDPGGLFSVYPNPSTETLNIEKTYSTTNNLNSISYDKNTIYNLFDFKLNLISKGNIKGLTTIDVSNYKRGRYILQIVSGENSETHHIIIN